MVIGRTLDSLLILITLTKVAADHIGDEGDEVVVINTNVMPTEIIILILLNLEMALVMDAQDIKFLMELITKLPLASNATVTL